LNFFSRSDSLLNGHFIFDCARILVALDIFAVRPRGIVRIKGTLAILIKLILENLRNRFRD